MSRQQQLWRVYGSVPLPRTHATRLGARLRMWLLKQLGVRPTLYHSGDGGYEWDRVT